MCSSKRVFQLFLGLGSGLWIGMAAVANSRSSPPTPVAEAVAPSDGAIFYQSMCTQCHGTRGEGNELIKAPSIAGRPAWYVERQLENFRHGRRGMKSQDVQGALMASIAKVLLPEQMKAVAEVVSKMPFVPPSSTVALKDPNLEEGRFLFMDRCAQCHRFNATGEMTFGSPPLIGLQDWYLLAQINKFKTGWRGVDPNDPNGTKMQQSSGYIESEQAKHDVVAFILSLNPKKEEGAPDSLFSETQATK